MKHISMMNGTIDISINPKAVHRALVFASEYLGVLDPSIHMNAIKNHVAEGQYHTLHHAQRNAADPERNTGQSLTCNTLQTSINTGMAMM